MNKSLVILGLALVLIFAVFSLRFILGGPEDAWLCQDGEWIKHGNPSQPMPEVACIGRTPLFYNDSISGLEIAYPSEWEEWVDIEYFTPLIGCDIDDGNICGRRIVFNYITKDESQEALLFILNLTALEVGEESVNNLPNHEVIMKGDEEIISLSRPLDMPFLPGSKDFERYTKMLEEADEVISKLRFYK